MLLSIVLFKEGPKIECYQQKKAILKIISVASEAYDSACS